MLLSPLSSCVAWFKLSELVARREKERALAIFRLMVHAWDDEAYILQLKGDLMCAFEDYDRAHDCYYGAIKLYDISGRFVQGSFVYEQILLVEVSIPLYKELIIRFTQLGYMPQIMRYIHKIIALGLVHNDLEAAFSLLEIDFIHSAERLLVRHAFECVLFALLQNYRVQGKQQTGAQFVEQLLYIDQPLYHVACAMLNRVDSL